jgi:hypothetical protein
MPENSAFNSKTGARIAEECVIDFNSNHQVHIVLS